MNIPDKVLNCLQHLEPLDYGLAVYAIVMFMRNEESDLSVLTPTARGSYEMALLVLKPILRRRERARERRRLKKILAEQSPAPGGPPSRPSDERPAEPSGGKVNKYHRPGELERGVEVPDNRIDPLHVRQAHDIVETLRYVRVTGRELNDRLTRHFAMSHPGYYSKVEFEPSTRGVSFYA